MAASVKQAQHVPIVQAGRTDGVQSSPPSPNCQSVGQVGANGALKIFNQTMIKGQDVKMITESCRLTKALQGGLAISLCSVGIYTLRKVQVVFRS